MAALMPGSFPETAELVTRSPCACARGISTMLGAKTSKKIDAAQYPSQRVSENGRGTTPPSHIWYVLIVYAYMNTRTLTVRRAVLCVNSDPDETSNISWRFSVPEHRPSHMS